MMEWAKIDRLLTQFLVETDAYVDWRRGAGASARSSDAARPVVICLKPTNSAAELQEAARGEGSEPALRLPGFYVRPAIGLEDTQWCTGLATPEFFDLLTKDSPKQSAALANLIERVSVFTEPDPPEELVALSSEELVALSPEERPDGRGRQGPWPAGSVVIGIIDFGIAFAHERFRHDRTRTRIEHLWVQDAYPVPGKPGTGEVPYGREIRAGTINAWLEDHSAGTDEDALYAKAARVLGRCWLRSVSRRMGHGTHVLDLAAGYRLDEEERERRPIIAVQLPEATVADTSGASLDPYVIDGIRFILQRAQEIAGRAGGKAPLPVVINFSSGEVAGPHDGSSDPEQAMDELIRLRSRIGEPLGIVISAGNSHLGRLHARMFDDAATASEPVHLPWHVLPDDATPSYMEIWLPHGPPKGGSRVSVTIKAPGDEAPSDPLDETMPGAGLRYMRGGSVICEARYQQVGGRGMFLIAVQPTLHDGSPEAGHDRCAVAPAGTWTVTLENTGLGGLPVEAWVQWDDTPLGFRRRGRQSYLDHPGYSRFDTDGKEIDQDLEPAGACPVRRGGSMNAFATGSFTVVVGGFVADADPASYSAGGPFGPTGAAGLPGRVGPDMMATSDDSSVHLGVLAAGTRSGSTVSMSGTSVAAPQITRKLAEEWSPLKQVRGPESPDPPADLRKGIGLVSTRRERTREERLGLDAAPNSVAAREQVPDEWRSFMAKRNREVWRVEEPAGVV
jgi:hypothetical protein